VTGSATASGAIVGIDLGTTNSCVSLYRDKRPQIIVNAEGQRTTPSVVTFNDDGSVLVGAPARRQAIMSPQQTITGVKRLVGRRFESHEVLVLREISPYEIVRARNGDAWVQVGGRAVSPPEVQSHVLERLRQCAEVDVGGPVTRAVVTVPAYFDETQRQATRDAAAIAGLDAVRILNEPTAAALAYGHARSQGKHLIVIDLGGGTFDVTVMAVEDGVFEVLATTGDMLLGGEDFDRAIARRLGEEIYKEHGVDVFSDPVAAQRLITEAEEAKKQLTELDTVMIGLPFLAMGPRGPVNVQRRLRRAEFEDITASLIARLVEPCRVALADARLTPAQIDDTLLVGGMTRCVAVQRQIADLFGRRPSMRINPDEAIAVGAGLESAILEGQLQEVVLIDVASHTIGLRTAGNKMVPLIPRSTPLPTRVTKVFSTTRDNQDYVEVEVLQGDDPTASGNRRLSWLRLEGLPPAPKGTVRVAVTFAVDASGLLSVSARDKTSGKRAHVNVVAESGLGRAEVARLADERRKAATP
jgi:molecular chaperone DnaK